MRFDLAHAIVFLPPLVVAITAHEFAHAWSASLLGDDFARRQGRVSLNPFRHLAPLGTLLILFLPFGWGRPVPVNLYNFKHPKRDYLLTSLAGPAANALVVVLCFLLMLLTRKYYGLGAFAAASMYLAHEFLLLIALLNTMLAAVNLLPIPPLDGSKIWPCLIPGLKPTFGKEIMIVSVVVLIVLLWSGALGPALNAVMGTVDALMPASERDVFEDAFDRGMEAWDKQDYAAVEHCFTRALAVNPGSDAAWSSRAHARERLGRTEAALADINRAIELHGRLADYFEFRAGLLAKLSRPDEELADLETTDLLRGDPQAWADLQAAAKQNAGASGELKKELPKVKFAGLGLGDVIQFFRDVSRAEVEVDWSALGRMGISPETPVNVDLREATLREVLKATLASAGGEREITYGVAGGRIIIPAPGNSGSSP